MKKTDFTIFVVEDNDWYNKLLVHTIGLNPDFTVRSFFSGKELLGALHQGPQVVTLDYRLPDMNGEELLKKIKEFNPLIEVLVISEQQDIETAVDLLRSGAYDYLVKSEDIRDRLLNKLNHIRSNSELQAELSNLRSEVQQKYDLSDSILGNSNAIRTVFQMAEKALNVDITVSISGETGTGKEVFAKAIHYNSNRKNNKFVAVNIAAIPSELIESELFGHEKGAFTGAANRRIGKFEEANGGTLFLDEIGEIDLSFQKKLLRVLQEREVVRIGSNSTVKVDCRIIVATHKDLAEEVKAGRFREDLYYRLKGLPIHLPPLRDRDNDIILLASHFLKEFSKVNKLTDKKISSSAANKLMGYSWPGNVRELKSVIELAAVLSAGDEINADDISLGNQEDILPDLLVQDLSLREYDIRIVQHYMQRFDNDTKEVAKALNIGQTTVYRLLKEAKS